MILPKERDPRFVTIRRGGTLTDSDHHLLALWAASCAEHVLDLFESAQPKDPRPPVLYDHDLSQAARFHCTHLSVNGGGLSHQTFCTLRDDLESTACDGTAACSCMEGTECWNCDTLGGCGSGPSERAAIFGFPGGVAEVAGQSVGALAQGSVGVLGAAAEAAPGLVAAVGGGAAEALGAAAEVTAGVLGGIVEGLGS